MRLFVILSIFAILVSCAKVPREKSHIISSQEKLQATKHWDRMAKKVAQDMESELGIGGGPVFVQNHDHSQFGLTMRTLITSKLQNKGMVVSQNRNSLYKLSWNVQLVTHKANRINSGGLLTFIFSDLPQALIFGENTIGEYASHSEAVITFNLKYEDTSLFRNTKIYYVNSEDSDHYWDIPEYTDQNPTKSKTFTSVTK